jgi:nicotinamide-nucleotide amidase
MQDSDRLEEKIGKFLSEPKKTVSVAESCTGGLVSHRITNIPGSSKYYNGGVISYSYQPKIDVLHVSPETIQKFGAVSRQTATEMAIGVRRLFGTDLGVAITGIAGPDGGSVEKPVGLVHICLSVEDKMLCEQFDFDGSREEIKGKSADAALRLVVDYLLDLKR